MSAARRIQAVAGDGTKYEIPEAWLIGRTYTREREGLTPMRATRQAIEDWHEQAKMAAAFEQQQS